MVIHTCVRMPLLVVSTYQYTVQICRNAGFWWHFAAACLALCCGRGGRAWSVRSMLPITSLQLSCTRQAWMMWMYILCCFVCTHR